MLIYFILLTVGTMAGLVTMFGLTRHAKLSRWIGYYIYRQTNRTYTRICHKQNKHILTIDHNYK